MIDSTGHRQGHPSEQVFRPSEQHILRRVSPWLLLAIAVIYLYPAVGKLTEWWHVNPVAAVALVAGSVVVLVAIVWVVIRIHRQATELLVQPDCLVYVSVFRHRSLPRQQLGRLVRGEVLLQLLQSPDYRSQQLLLIDRAGRCFLRLGPEWDHIGLSHAIGVAIEPFAPGMLTAGDVRRAFPNSYNWVAAHPGGRYVVGLGLGCLSIPIIFGLIALFGSRH